MKKDSNFFLFVLLGIVFWFVGVIAIRIIGPYILTENNPLLFLGYVINIPFAFLFLYITRWLSKLPLHELLRPMVIMTFTALTCDSIAFSWFHEIYHPSYPIAVNGAAQILFGGGLGLMIAYYFDQKDKPT